MHSSVRSYGWALALILAVGGALGLVVNRDSSGPVLRGFDQPDLALQFYVNSRTGPIITRGANVTTGIRPLSPSAYLPALRHMRDMPRFSAATRAVLPSYADDPAFNDGPAALLQTWSSLGPANQGGRTRALLIDPTNPDIMYAGGVTGGVWKSTDAGGTWRAISDLQRLYAATSRGNFRSTNGGASWTNVVGASHNGCTDLAVQVHGAGYVFAGCGTYGPGAVYRAPDDGVSPFVNVLSLPTLEGGAPATATLEVTGAINASLQLGPVDTFSYAGVPPGTYTFRVRTSNRAGSSPPSNPVTLTFPGGCGGPPHTVTNFVAYSSGGTVFLAWDPPAAGPAPTGYVIRVSGAYVGDIPTAYRRLTAAAPGGTYHVSVLATNACGAGAPTAAQSVTVP